MMKNRKYKDTRTGAIVERFSIMDIQFMEELKE